MKKRHPKLQKTPYQSRRLSWPIYRFFLRCPKSSAYDASGGVVIVENVNKPHQLDFLVVKRKDMLNQHCNRCLGGKYKEISLYNDWEGTLSCHKCGHTVERHLPIEQDGKIQYETK